MALAYGSRSGPTHVIATLLAISTPPQTGDVLLASTYRCSLARAHDGTRTRRPSISLNIQSLLGSAASLRPCYFKQILNYNSSN